ncbi:hypothetical protein AAG906_014402 [Vitis piasezkii]
MADEERNLVEILEEHNVIDIAKYINYVSAPQAGAVATFSGTTRDTFDGKTVLELRYEAYVPMAIRCINDICSSARASWSLLSIAVAHRLGPVPVGETSVFIAISSVHRADALDACKFVIDEIKASVPIWEKEVYANGEVEAQERKSCCGAKVKVEGELKFLERRSELGNAGLQEGGTCCSRKVKVEAQERKGCCGAKVKVDVE